MNTMEVTLRIVVEAKEENGALPLPAALAATIEEQMYDSTKHDSETRWMLRTAQLVSVQH